MGDDVISLLNDTVVVVPKPKHTMLPLLVVLFLASYGLMALLVVEQGRTIDTQRNLIVQLFSDSTELSHMKGKAVQEANHARGLDRPQAPAQVHPPQTLPSNPAEPQANNKNGNSAAKFRKPLPQKPSQDGQEMADERRSSKSI